MKNKKGIIILASVVGICAVGYALSRFIDWPVDMDNASGNIAKSSRFSRKTATEGLSNMEELLASDPSYKDGIVAAHMVMQARALHFGTLVDMSNEVAGDIPAYADVLKGMNEARTIVDNVSASLDAAGKDLNAALGGEQCPDLAQNTINAALAYTTLQKQNKLADQFIDITEQYLQSADADNRLKFVRDQWMDYQQMTAALENDIKRAEDLARKGALLTAEQSVNTLGEFKVPQQVVILFHSNMSHNFGIGNSLIGAVPEQVFGQLSEVIQDASSITLRDAEITPQNALRESITDNMQNFTGADSFVKALGWNNLAAQPKDNLAEQPTIGLMRLLELGGMPNISEVFQDMKLREQGGTDNLNQAFVVTGQLNQVIHETAVGEVATLHSRI